MASRSDQYVTIGEETTYGTQASAMTRGYESQVDDWRPDTESDDSGGFRSGRQAVLSNRQDIVETGASGSIEIPLLTRGAGMILKHLLGNPTDPDEQGVATGAYLSKVDSNSTGPNGSHSVQVGRVDDAGVLRATTYLGSVPTGFSLAATTGENNVMLTVQYDARTASRTPAVVTPVYPGGRRYRWDYSKVQVNAADAVNITGWSFNADLMMEVDRHYLIASALKSVPMRNGIPAFGGTLNTRLLGTAFETRWLEGERFSLTFITTFPVAINTTYYPYFKIHMPSVRITDGPPESDPDGGPTTETLEYEAGWDGTNDAVQIEYLSEDDMW